MRLDADGVLWLTRDDLEQGIDRLDRMADPDDSLEDVIWHVPGSELRLKFEEE